MDGPRDSGGAWRPAAGAEILRLRARLLGRIRAFFEARGVLEVETPVLSTAAVTDPHIESLQTRCSALPDPLYLHTSPEFPMKRLLAAGSGCIYQIARVFRDGELGRRHNPEFTLVEWYRVGFDHRDLMAEIEALLATLGLAGACDREPYRDAFLRHAGVDPLQASDADLAAGASPLGPSTLVSNLGRDGLMDLIFSHRVAPALGHERPLFLYDYPAEQAALARVRPGPPAVAERFELFMNGMEIANGFHELADASEQRQRFLHDLAHRRTAGLAMPPMDEHLLAALEAGLPDCAGVALGFDRLVMAAAGSDDIRQVMAFPAERA